MIKSPLIVFVHTPKTAGSTVNASLETIGKGVSHIEKFQHEPDRIRSLALSCRWISGHLPIYKFQNILASVDREVKFFSCVREPMAQVMSHFNWLIEIYFRGADFYNGHPERIKLISKEIRGCNRSDSSVIVRLLAKYRGLFLNYQSQFFRAEGSHLSSFTIDDQLKEFSYVAYDRSSVEYLIKDVFGCDYHGGDSNSSRYHFDPKAFSDGEVRDFLTQNNDVDAFLFNSVFSKFNIGENNL